jgi:hypothetical protein
MEYLWDNVSKVLVHQTKIEEIFMQESYSALFDDSGDYVIQLQISYLIPFIKASPHAGAM